jgi:hypothetical protein
MTLAAVGPGFFPLIGRGIGAILLYAVLGVLLMREGLPNSVLVTSAGMISMAFIVVTAIYSSTGTLVEGLLGALVFGLVGIVAQVGGVRLLEWVTGIRIGRVLQSEILEPEAWVVAAAHVALGLVVAVAIV